MASLSSDFLNRLSSAGSSATTGTPYAPLYGYGGIPEQYHKYIAVGNRPRMLPPQYNSRGAQVLDLNRAAAEQAFYNEFYPDYEGFLGGGADQDGGLGAARDGALGQMRPPNYSAPASVSGSNGTSDSGGSLGGNDGGSTGGGAGNTTTPSPYTAPLQQQPIPVAAPGSAAIPGQLVGYPYAGDIPAGWAVGPTTRGTGLRAGTNLTQVRW